MLRPCRIAGALCYAQGPWDPAESRVSYLSRVFYGAQRLLRPLRSAGASRAPRVLCGAQRLLRPFRARLVFAGPLGSIRIASSMSPTRALWCPAFVATPQICKFHICCACFMVPSVCCDPSTFHICCTCFMVPSVCCDPLDLRIPHLLRVFYGAQRLLRPLRFANSTSVARVLWCPAFATTP